MTQSLTLTRILDASAVGLSGLCLLHCLALPVAVAFLPFTGAWAEAEWVHLLFLGVAVPVSITALARSGGWRSWQVGGLALVGLVLLAGGALLVSDPRAEVGLTGAGGLALASAHLLNWRRHQKRC